MSIQRKIARAANRAKIGLETRVLVEGPSSETDLLWEGRTPGQAPEIDGVCLVNDVEGGALRRGQIRRFRVTAAGDYDLIGTILEEDEAPRKDLLPVLGQSRR
jgi:ribosomal protein S12 methylthiotransferase